MKFVAVEDIAAPIDHVWSRVSDVETFETRMSSRAKNVTRTPSGPPGEGTNWTAQAEIMGKIRDIKVTLTQLRGPDLLTAMGVSNGMDVTIRVELVEQSPRLTRLTVTSEAKAKSLSARLMLQSAKLARQSMAKRYKSRVAEYAAKVEGSFAKTG